MDTRDLLYSTSHAGFPARLSIEFFLHARDRVACMGEALLHYESINNVVSLASDRMEGWR